MHAEEETRAPQGDEGQGTAEGEGDRSTIVAAGGEGLDTDFEDIREAGRRARRHFEETAWHAILGSQDESRFAEFAAYLEKYAIRNTVVPDRIIFGEEATNFDTIRFKVRCDFHPLRYR